MSAVLYRRMRVDVLVCVGLAYLLSLGTGKVAGVVSAATYESHVEAHTVADGEIGGAAGETVYRAESVEDLLCHDMFTVISPGIEFRNRGGGYYGGSYFDLLTLPSGETVAAHINKAGIQYEGDYYTSDKILPVGRVVREPLYEDSTFLKQIQSVYPLSRSDFYIDMMGDGGALNLEAYSSGPVAAVQLITVVLAFPLIHMLGAKIGIFPYFFSPKKLRESEWE